jgi:hypothetical protein
MPICPVKAIAPWQRGKTGIIAKASKASYSIIKT